MTAQTILYIIVACVFALGIAIFMYGYKSKYSGSLRWLFGALRFISLFSILLLLINPKFKSETYTVEKPKLPVLIDNSASVVALNQDDNVKLLVRQLKEDDALNDKFDLSFFSFGSNLNDSDSLSFSEPNTNISKTLAAVNDLFKTETAPTIIVTDGNQTLGSDYEFSSIAYKNQVYPVILGDSTKYTDLKIEQLNTNRYSFLKNEFPVEVILVYNGIGPTSSQFIVKQGTSIVHRQNISFSERENTQTLSFTISASSVGLQKYEAQLLPIEGEKNTINNVKQFAVEVIDQATKVLIVSKIVHPDLGTLRKSVEANEQRTVTVKKPSEATVLINDFQLVILYQPNRSFSAVFSELNKLKKNTFIFSGNQTDWNFLNTIQDNYNKDVGRQTEDVSGVLNSNYGTFSLEDIGFEGFRPLSTLFGTLEVLVPHEIVLNQYIDGFESDSPMLVTTEINGVRSAIWDGEGIWKWRAQSFLDTNSFEDFDNFMGKFYQYLASNKRRSRLEVTNETFYYNNNPIKISSQYFDQNFEFDSRASLSIAVTNTATSKRTVFPMLLKNNFYEVDLNSLNAGEYTYTVSVSDMPVARSGSFTILDFNVEQQFLNANVTKLNSLATNTNGKAFYITQSTSLINNLLKDNRFQKIQKSEQKVVPLIDWKYLLALIILSLIVEWFIRKFNGLI
jgi:hypothetical protein